MANPHLPQGPGALAFVLAVLSSACTAPSTSPDDAAYVLLDADARTHGALEGEGWRGSPALPVPMTADEPLRYRSRSADRTLPFVPGTLTLVEGRAASIRSLRLGADVREDALFLQATTEAATELAMLVAGEAALEPDGRHRLEVSDLLARTAYLTHPPGLVGVSPVPVDDPGLPAFEGLPTWTDAGPLPVLDAEGRRLDDAGERDAEVVGLYGAGESVLVLDAMGRATLLGPCTEPPLRTGVFHTLGERVIVSLTEGPWVLTRAGDALVTPEGDPLLPLLATEQVVPSPETAEGDTP